jgi:hypothetical protein
LRFTWPVILENDTKRIFRLYLSRKTISSAFLCRLNTFVAMHLHLSRFLYEPEELKNHTEMKNDDLLIFIIWFNKAHIYTLFYFHSSIEGLPLINFQFLFTLSIILCRISELLLLFFLYWAAPLHKTLQYNSSLHSTPKFY